MVVRGILAIVAIALPMSAAHAEVAGVAGAIDGDTLVVGETRVRLFGIDAPELAQTCGRADGTPWPCGEAAAARLRALVAGAWLRCRPRDVDRYGRIVATCSVAGDDLGETLVREGLALAYRAYADRYVTDEAAARAAGAGVWAGPFDAPWDWRRRPPVSDSGN